MQDKIGRFWHRKIAKDAREITIMPAVRWGNILYFILNCYSHKKFLVASKPQTDNWLYLFPELKKFFLEPGEVKDWDFPQGVKNYYQFLGEDFSYQVLKDFIEEFFLKSALILEAKKITAKIFSISTFAAAIITPKTTPRSTASIFLNF